MRAFSRILLSLMMLCFAAAGIYFSLTSPILQVNQVEIDLDSRAAYGLPFPKIKDALDIRLKKYAGNFVWQVDLEEIFNIAKADLRVQSVNVRRRLPNRIQVEVLPHTPIANILGQSSDRVFPMARDGEVLPAVPTLEASDAPLLRGHRFLEDKNLRASALELLLSLPSEGPVALQNISEIDFHKRRGFQLTISPEGTEIWLGFEDFTRRLSQAQRVLSYIENKNMNGRVIDARYAKKVVVKLRNEP